MFDNRLSLPATSEQVRQLQAEADAEKRSVASLVREAIDQFLPRHLPRLLMAWISTEAVRTQSRVLVLGDSLSDFMRELGIYSSDGKAYTRLRNQMERLFNASVRLIYEDKHGKQFVSSAIADRGEFWWDPEAAQ